MLLIICIIVLCIIIGKNEFLLLCRDSMPKSLTCHKRKFLVLRTGDVDLNDVIENERHAYVHNH